MSKAKKYCKNKFFMIITLVLAIGGLGTSGSLAYFTSVASVEPNLTVETGTLLVNFVDDRENNINKSINIDKLIPGKSGSDTFEIKNCGSLNEKVNFKFNEPTGKIDSEGLKHFSYLIKFENLNNKEQSKAYAGKMDELLLHNKSLDVINNDGDKIILKPGERLKATVTLSLDDTINYKYENKKENFSVNVIGTQINDEDWK